MKDLLSRQEILNKAYHDCMCEMYAKAQPEADWDNILEEYRTGKLTKDDRVYDKYKEAYNIKKTWVPNLEFLEELLTEGGMKDKYNPDWTDKNGNHHPGYRSAEKVKPLKEQIENLLTTYDSSDISKEIANNIFELVINNIKNYKDFYKFDREEDEFDINISLGASPTSNAETVKKWWKENYNQDIEIEERNPKLFWYRDNNYTDEDLAEEFNSDNWKEIVDKEWEEEKTAKKREQEERLKKFQEEYGQKEA